MLTRGRARLRLEGADNPDIICEGIDGSECESFITAIHMRAHEEEWINDEKRLLYFAVSRLRKKALRWYATLDSADRSDWGRFMQALFAKYPETDDTTASSDLRHFS